MAEDIRLGQIVEDVASGLRGMAQVRVDMLSGNVQFAIQPKGEPNEMKDSQWIDHHTLKVVEPGIADTLPKADTAVTAILGKEYRDIISDFKGIAIEKHTYLNGCVYFSLQGKNSSERIDGQPASFRVEHKRLKEVGRGMLTREETKAPPVRSSGTGGPSRRGPSTKVGSRPLG